MEVARADAEKIRLIGSSEATSIEAVGKAEAERMRLKASAYKQYGDAAMLSLVLETLPKVGKLFYIHKALIRIANWETLIRLLPKKQSNLGLHCLSRSFWQATSVQNFTKHSSE